MYCGLKGVYLGPKVCCLGMFGDAMERWEKGVLEAAAVWSAHAGADHHDEDSLFLSWLRVHLACCTKEEQLEMLRICREGAATRYPGLGEQITHIVVSPPLHIDA